MKDFVKKHQYHLIILLGLVSIAGASAYYAYREPLPSVANQAAPIAVIFRLGESLEEKIELPAGATVFTLMETLQKNGQLSFRAKDFGGALGVFIEELNGVSNTREQFWIYYINNQKAQAGVSNYTLQTGDLIDWKYETGKDL